MADPNIERHKAKAMQFISTTTLFSEEKYNKILQSVQNFDAIPKNERTPQMRKWKRKYYVQSFPSGSDSRTVSFLYDEGTKTRYVHMNNVFDIVYNHHSNNAHRTSRAMWQELKADYNNISENICKYICDTCPICHQKKLPATKHRGAKKQYLATVSEKGCRLISLTSDKIRKRIITMSL